MERCWKVSSLFILPSRCIDPSLRKVSDMVNRMENGLPGVNYSNRESNRDYGEF